MNIQQIEVRLPRGTQTNCDFPQERVEGPTFLEIKASPVTSPATKLDSVSREGKWVRQGRE